MESGPLLIDAGGGFDGGFLDGFSGWGTVGPLTATFDGRSKQFFGFSSDDQDIASVTIGGNGNEVNFAIDNFEFSSTAMPTTSVPEPGTFALLAVGGVITAGFARRRKQA